MMNENERPKLLHRASHSSFSIYHSSFALVDYSITNHIQKGKTLMQDAIGLLETKGLVALVEATDAMAKAANVRNHQAHLDRRRIGDDRRARRRRQRAGGRRSRRSSRDQGRRADRQPHHSAPGEGLVAAYLS